MRFHSLQRLTGLVLLLGFVVASAIPDSASGEDYYVSAANGQGRTGSKDKPAKDLGNLVSKLAPGDTVHIAGGIYLGRGECGTCVINVPVKIIGGYDETFSTRDPWGEYKTVFSGVNASNNWQRDPGLLIDLMKYREKDTFEIVVDGIIVDHGDRNRYSTDEQKMIVRAANPKTGENPTPESGGIVIRASRVMSDDVWSITVQNCVVMNTAPTQGALSVSAHQGAHVTIRNNLVINNTGTGIMTGSNYQGTDEALRPVFDVNNNTVLFTWKFDPIVQSFSGNSLVAGENVVLNASQNLLGFADKFGVHNEAKAPVLLVNNLILVNIVADYLEFDTKISLDDMLDEAEFVNEESDGNVAEPIEIPVPAEWAADYGARVLIDRNAIEADIEAQQTAANELRSILGLPLQAGEVEGPEVSVWLNRISIDDALNVGAQKYLGSYGCQKPGT